MNLRRPHLLVTALVLVLLGAGIMMPHSDQKGLPVSPIVEDHLRRNIAGLLHAALPPVDCAETACMALTFDDGPDRAYTPKVLDILAAKKAKATFFLLGTKAAAHPDIVRRIHLEGHEIGNHSWNHPNLTKLSVAQIRDQVLLTQNAIVAAGVPAPQWFRPPYGAMNPQVRAHVPMAIGLWNVDPEDWDKKDKHAIKDHINAHAGPGRIVDLHDMHGPTAEALPIIIDDLSGHYKLVTMSELFNAQHGQRGEFYGR
jgi:peptidoglycan-N-acetylglucosamine deacetylase